MPSCCFSSADVEWRARAGVLVVQNFLCPEVYKRVLADADESHVFEGGAYWEDRLGSSFPGVRFEYRGEHAPEFAAGEYLKARGVETDDSTLAAFKSGELFKSCLDRLSTRQLSRPPWPLLTAHGPDCSASPLIFAPSCVSAQSVRDPAVEHNMHQAHISTPPVFARPRHLCVQQVRSSYMTREAHAAIIHHDFEHEVPRYVQKFQPFSAS